MTAPILQERPITPREALIPYAMAGINMLAATVATRGQVMPEALLVSILFILVGLPLSVFFRQRGYNRITLNMLVGIPLLIFAWLLVRSHPGLQFNLLDPYSLVTADNIAHLDEAVLNLVIIIAAGRALLLVTANDLVWTPLPSISILLLTVVAGGPGESLEAARTLLVSLLLLFVSSLYLFSHEHSQLWYTIHTPVRVQRQLLAWVLICTFALFPLVVLLGWFMQPINMFSMMQRQRGRQQGETFFRNLGSIRPSIGVSPTIDMGGANWPTGKSTVMTVEVSREAMRFPLLWRTATYAAYAEGKWELELPSPVWPSQRDWQIGNQDLYYELRIDPRGESGDPGIAQAIMEEKLDVEAATVRQVFNIIAPVVGHDLPIYAAYLPTLIRSTNPLLRFARVGPGTRMYIFQHTDNTFEQYEAFSVVKPPPTTLRLSKAPRLAGGEREHYLRMRGGNSFIHGEQDGYFATTIRYKAAQILKRFDSDPLRAAENDYETVTRFEQYLGENYRYTLRPSSPPIGEDPIIDFLYEQKQGYCNYFSGSMVMLCRSVGIPARLAVGFATGDEIEETDSDSETVRFRVTEEHAHSWVEVYLKDYGWYTVDPTAGSERVPTLFGSLWDGMMKRVTAMKEFFAAWQERLREDRRMRLTAYLALASVAACVGVVLYLRRERPLPFPARPLSPDEAHRVTLQVYRRMHRWLRRWGVTKPEGLTAREFDALFSALNTPMGDLVSAVSRLYLRAQYGKEPLTDADAREAIGLLQRLWEVARVERKHLHAAEAEER